MQMDFEFLLEQKDESIALYAKQSLGFLFSFAATLLLLTPGMWCSSFYNNFLPISSANQLTISYSSSEAAVDSQGAIADGDPCICIMV